ncbi:MAG: aromatic-ring-opening dioxygenase LigAB, LigA subunit [Solirubrobacterales bacterium]|nr:aromatic-ring-opening dioxygenase LigAB, LigA subunit [Solirubrobacterales bacterium]
MSVYAVNKVCRRLVHEPELRAALAASPQSAEAALRAAHPPLSEDEVRQLLAGDVGALSQAGCNHFLMSQLGRFELFGLDLREEAARVRAAHR